MIVKALVDTIDTPAHVKGTSFESRRLLLASDNLGYSLHDTICKAGTVQELHYQNHIETNYVIEGQGAVEDVATGEVYPLAPGSVYVLDQHDAHILRAETDMRIVCIFTPALTGRETHDKDGNYSAAPQPA